ncbi:MAG: SpoIIE family protein phosphatase [Myxococcota bacterium]
MQNRTRPRIGLILYGIDYSYQESILRGADEECREQDADLICFAGGSVALNQLADATYDVMEPAALDGLLIATSTIGSAIGSKELAALLARFASIPICSLGYEMPDALSVTVDGASSVERLTRHLIEVHGRRRLAFVQGNNNESDERLAAFLLALARAGIEPRPELIFPGNFRNDAGQHAVEALLAQAQREGQSAFPADAIVAANDWMALGALRALEAAGLRVPEDVSVVGFDDIDPARFEMPSLTTIRQPAESLGAHGIRALLARHRGEPQASLTRLPTEQKLRKSCGCFSSGQARHSLGVDAAREDTPTSGEDRLLRVTRALDEAAPGFKAALTHDWANQMLAALDADLSRGGDNFATLLESFIRRTANLGNVAAWHHVITTLRKQALSAHKSPGELARGIDLFDMAQVLVSAHAERAQGARRLSKEALLRALSQLSEELRAASSYAQISAVLAQQLPRLDVPGCLLTVHEGKLEPETQSRVITAYDVERGVLPVSAPVRAGDLIPLSVAPSRRSTWLARVATFEHDIVGFCMLEVNAVETARYISICEQVGVSLNAVRLLRARVEEMTRRERAERERLESEIELAKRIQTGILPRMQEVRGLRIASAMHPATEVGGDYFDVLPSARGAWFAIGDVTGHGLPAGLVMLMIQSLVAATTAAEPEGHAASIWLQVNRLLYENVRHRLQQDEHATLTLLHYDGAGVFEFAGAHEEILVHRSQSGVVEAVPTPGIWAGITADPAPEAVQNTVLRLTSGDTMLLYTDGMLEARNAEGELFGTERLCREFADVSHLPVEGIVERLMQAVHAWMHEQDDDITLVVVRYVGDAA